MHNNHRHNKLSRTNNHSSSHTPSAAQHSDHSASEKPMDNNSNKHNHSTRPAMPPGTVRARRLYSRYRKSKVKQDPPLQPAAPNPNAPEFKPRTSPSSSSSSQNNNTQPSSNMSSPFAHHHSSPNASSHVILSTPEKKLSNNYVSDKKSSTSSHFLSSSHRLNKDGHIRHSPTSGSSSSQLARSSPSNSCSSSRNATGDITDENVVISPSPQIEEHDDDVGEDDNIEEDINIDDEDDDNVDDHSDDDGDDDDDDDGLKVILKDDENKMETPKSSHHPSSSSSSSRQIRDVNQNQNQNNNTPGVSNASSTSVNTATMTKRFTTTQLVYSPNGEILVSTNLNNENSNNCDQSPRNIEVSTGKTGNRVLSSSLQSKCHKSMDAISNTENKKQQNQENTDEIPQRRSHASTAAVVSSQKIETSNGKSSSSYGSKMAAARASAMGVEALSVPTEQPLSHRMTNNNNNVPIFSGTASGNGFGPSDNQRATGFHQATFRAGSNTAPNIRMNVSAQSTSHPQHQQTNAVAAQLPPQPSAHMTTASLYVPQVAGFHTVGGLAIPSVSTGARNGIGVGSTAATNGTELGLSAGAGAGGFVPNSNLGATATSTASAAAMTENELNVDRLNELVSKIRGQPSASCPTGSHGNGSTTQGDFSTARARPLICQDITNSNADTLRISRLPRGVTYDRLYSMVEPFGEVEELVWTASDPYVCDVTYRDAAAAHEAKHFLNDAIVGNDSQVAVKAELRSRDPGAQLFVGDLTQDVTEEMLEQAFSEMVGGNVSALLKRDPDSLSPIGYGFLSFESEASANQALIAGHRAKIGNACVRVGRAERNTYLYVSDLSGGVSMDDLRNVFGRFGPLVEEDSMIVRRSYAFIRYKNRNAAERAKRTLDKTDLKGRLCVRYAEAEPLKACVAVQFHSSVPRAPNSLRDLVLGTFSKHGNCSVEIPRMHNGNWRKVAFVTFHGDAISAHLAALDAVQSIRFVSSLPVCCQFARELIPRMPARGLVAERISGGNTDRIAGTVGHSGGGNASSNGGNSNSNNNNNNNNNNIGGVGGIGLKVNANTTAGNQNLLAFGNFHVGNNNNLAQQQQQQTHQQQHHHNHHQHYHHHQQQHHPTHVNQQPHHRNSAIRRSSFYRRAEHHQSASVAPMHHHAPVVVPTIHTSLQQQQLQQQQQQPQLKQPQQNEDSSNNSGETITPDANSNTATQENEVDKTNNIESRNEIKFAKAKQCANNNSAEDGQKCEKTDLSGSVKDVCSGSVTEGVDENDNQKECKSPDRKQAGTIEGGKKQNQSNTQPGKTTAINGIGNGEGSIKDRNITESTTNNNETKESSNGDQDFTKTTRANKNGEANNMVPNDNDNKSNNSLNNSKHVPTENGTNSTTGYHNDNSTAGPGNDNTHPDDLVPILVPLSAFHHPHHATPAHPPPAAAAAAVHHAHAAAAAAAAAAAVAGHGPASGGAISDYGMYHHSHPHPHAHAHAQGHSHHQVHTHAHPWTLVPGHRMMTPATSSSLHNLGPPMMGTFGNTFAHPPHTHPHTHVHPHGPPPPPPPSLQPHASSALPQQQQQQNQLQDRVHW